MGHVTFLAVWAFLGPGTEFEWVEPARSGVEMTSAARFTLLSLTSNESYIRIMSC